MHKPPRHPIPVPQCIRRLLFAKEPGFSARFFLASACLWRRSVSVWRRSGECWRRSVSFPEQVRDVLAQVSVVSGAGQISGEGLAPPEGVRGRFAVLVSCVKPDLHRLFWGLAPGSRLTGTGEPTVLRQPALGPANRKKNFFFFRIVRNITKNHLKQHNLQAGACSFTNGELGL